MIKPIGSDELKPLFVYDSKEHGRLTHEAESLPSIMISSASSGNAAMMGGGYFTPLSGFMNLADAISCAENMKMTTGEFFPVPVLNLVQDVSAVKDARRIALRDPNVEGHPVIAIQEVEAIEEALTQSKGIQIKAAKMLGISLRQLRYRIKKYNITVRKINVL